MPNFNQFIGIGNMVNDPDLKYLPSGTAVCDFTIAMNRRWNDRQTGERKDDTCFLDVSIFGPRGEAVNEYFSKGKPILVVGHIKQERWETDDGQKRSKHKLIADRFEFVQSQAEAEASNDNGGQQTEGTDPAQAATPAPMSEEDETDDNIPF